MMQETLYFTITDTLGNEDIVGIETDKDILQAYLHMKELYTDYNVEYFLSSKH